MFQDWLPPNRPWGIRIWLVCHGILNFCWVLPTFSNLSDKYVKNTCDIWLLGKKTRRIRIWLVCHGILNFCWVFPDFIDKTMQNTHDTWLLGKYEEIPNMTCIFENFEFVGISFFYQENMYYLYFAYFCDEAQERPPQIQNFQKYMSYSESLHFLPRSHVSCVFCIIRVTKPMQDPTKVQNPMTD